MKRKLALAFGVSAYLAFLAVFVLLADFVGSFGVVANIDRGRAAATPEALAIDLGLIALFGVSHSVMARPWFKQHWVRPPIERSMYVLVASVSLGLIVWQWRTLDPTVWNVDGIAAYAVRALFALGIVLIGVSTFLTDHFDLFGLRHVWLYARGVPYTPVPFVERGLYRYVRHPMMVGVLIFVWATPTMTAGHVLFATAMTLYIGIGTAFEERDLDRTVGEPYRVYRRRVRAFLPLRPSLRAGSRAAASDTPPWSRPRCDTPRTKWRSRRVL